MIGFITKLFAKKPTITIRTPDGDKVVRLKRFRFVNLMYPVTDQLTRLFTKFATANNFSHVKDPSYGSKFYSTVKTEYGTLKFWISNSPHALGCRGTFINNKGEEIKWDDQMPSKIALEAFFYRLDILDDSMFPTPPATSVRIDTFNETLNHWKKFIS